MVVPTVSSHILSALQPCSASDRATSQPTTPHTPPHHTPHATTSHAPHPTAPSRLDYDADTLNEEASTRAPSPKSSATFPEKFDPSRATLLRPRALLGGG